MIFVSGGTTIAIACITRDNCFWKGNIQESYLQSYQHIQESSRYPLDSHETSRYTQDIQESSKYTLHMQESSSTYISQSPQCTIRLGGNMISPQPEFAILGRISLLGKFYHSRRLERQTEDQTGANGDRKYINSFLPVLTVALIK